MARPQVQGYGSAKADGPGRGGQDLVYRGFIEYVDTEEEETTMIAMELRDLRAAAEDTRGSSPHVCRPLGLLKASLRTAVTQDAMRTHARSCEHLHSSLCALPVSVCACFC